MQADVQLNRKVMSELAVHEPRSFAALTALAQQKSQEAKSGLKLVLQPAPEAAKPAAKASAHA